MQYSLLLDEQALHCTEHCALCLKVGFAMGAELVSLSGGKVVMAKQLAGGTCFARAHFAHYIVLAAMPHDIGAGDATTMMERASSNLRAH